MGLKYSVDPEIWHVLYELLPTPVLVFVVFFPRQISFVFLGIFRSQAISHGTVLRNEKNIRKSVFYVLSRVLHPESNRIGLALLRVLAILW